MSPKCNTHKAIAKHARIVWLDKGQWWQPRHDELTFKWLSCPSKQYMHALRFASRTQASARFVTGESCFPRRAIIIIIAIIAIITIANVIDIFLSFIYFSFIYYFFTASVRRVTEDYYLPKGIVIYLPAWYSEISVKWNLTISFYALRACQYIRHRNRRLAS